jgi:hypothetical protein
MTSIRMINVQDIELETHCGQPRVKEMFFYGGLHMTLECKGYQTLANFLGASKCLYLDGQRQ